MYCVEFEVTKDGSFDFSPENALCRQLIFSPHLTPYQRENCRWVEYDPEKLLRQDITAVDLWEKKFASTKCQWEQIEYKDGSKHWAWIIHEGAK